jgi:hypothetical protein
MIQAALGGLPSAIGFKLSNGTDMKPGLSVNIIVAVDILQEATDVRGAIIYDIDGKNVILSQTNPPLTSRYTGKDVSVTYLVREKEDLARLGFEGKIVEIIEEYTLSASNTAPAILVKMYTGFKKYNLRMHYRVKPKLNDLSIVLYLENQKMNLLDISIGGAFFCHQSDHMIEPGETRKMILSIDEQRFPIDARILSAWVPSGIGKPSNLQYVRVQFLNTDKTCNHVLSGRIMAIQRELLSKGR